MQLQKVDEIEIPDNNPWIHDALNRRPCAEILTKLIRTSNNPFVLSINANWGQGKTTFLKMWERQLTLEDQPCIYFNAWLCELSSDPLIVFISEINEYIKKVGGGKKTAEKIFSDIKKGSYELLKKTPKMMTKNALSNFVGQSNADEIFSSFCNIPQTMENEINDYLSFKNTIDNFKLNLEKLAISLTERKQKKGPIVILIDELDRCKPTYAVSVLERINHFFGAKGIVFIIAVDREQILTSIKTLYGNSIDAKNYLKRFIDLEYTLTEPDIRNYVYYLTKQYTFHSENEDRRENFQGTLNNILSSVATGLGLSLRTISQIVTHLYILYTILPNRRPYFNTLYIYLVCIRNHLDIYNKIWKKEIEFDDAIQKVHISFAKEMKNQSTMMILDYF